MALALFKYITAPITLLYPTVPSYTVIYCTLVYCTVIYCTVLYYTLLYSTVLYSTVLLDRQNFPPQPVRTWNREIAHTVSCCATQLLHYCSVGQLSTQYSSMYYGKKRCTALHRTALNLTALYFNVLHFTAL